MTPQRWKTYKLGEIAELRKEQVAPKGKRQPYIGLEHIEPQSLRLNGIGDSQDVISNKYKFYNGDILYGKLRPYFKKVYQPKFEGVCSTDIYVIKNKETIDRTLLFYLVASGEFTNIANSGSSGTRMPRAEWSQLLKSEWTIPENFDEQRRIASILSSLDDKIELNLQMNKTLESIAQAIFKEWFIDFRFPGFDGELVDGRPKGWRISDLGDVSTLVAGGDKPIIYSIHLDGQNIIPIYSNGISNEGLYGFTDKARISEESVTVSARGTIGYVCLRVQPYVPIVRLIAVIPNQNFISSKYLYLWLRNQNISGTGTTQQQLTVPDFCRSKILIPKMDIVNEFTLIMNSLFKKINSNTSEIQILARLRDTLLPKLMTGKIRVA